MAVSPEGHLANLKVEPLLNQRDPAALRIYKTQDEGGMESWRGLQAVVAVAAVMRMGPFMARSHSRSLGSRILTHKGKL